MNKMHNFLLKLVRSLITKNSIEQVISGTTIHTSYGGETRALSQTFWNDKKGSNLLEFF